MVPLHISATLRFYQSNLRSPEGVLYVYMCVCAGPFCIVLCGLCETFICYAFEGTMPLCPQGLTPAIVFCFYVSQSPHFALHTTTTSEWGLSGSVDLHEIMRKYYFFCFNVKAVEKEDLHNETWLVALYSVILVDLVHCCSAWLSWYNCSIFLLFQDCNQIASINSSLFHNSKNMTDLQ